MCNDTSGRDRLISRPKCSGGLVYDKEWEVPVKFIEKGINGSSGKSIFSGTMGAEQGCPGLRREWE